MSGSPKYTTADFDAQRRAQLEAARRQREAERRAREEVERQRRVQAAMQAAQQRAARITAQLQELGRRSAALPQHGAVRREAAQVTALATGIGSARDEAALTKLDKELRAGERRADKLGAEVARELTLREHAGALDVVLAPLGGLKERDVHDPQGFRTVTALTAEARSRIGDGNRFPDAHSRLSEATGGHLETVRDRQALMLRLANESDEVTARLTAVLEDAAAAGITVPDAGALAGDVRDLRAEVDGHHITRWEHRIAELRRKTEAATATVDAKLDQLERMTIMVEAASAALPAAGLRVVRESLAEHDDSVTFRAERVDGTSIELTVHAGDGRGTRLEYRTDADDVVVETTADGEVRTCDLTEQLLERFHTELAQQGVRTDGLHWEGKPERPRPPLQQALGAVAPDTRSLR